MTKREIVYMILDSIKSVSEDSYITEEHVLFLMNIYRSYLIELKKKQDKLFQLSESYQLEICLDLELVDSVPGVPCRGQYLKSIQEIPSTIDSSLSKVYPQDQFSDLITMVSKERFGFVGYNSYMSKIIYATLGANNHLYLKSDNPLFKYMDKVKFAGVFEDAEKAEELSCDKNNEDGECVDTLDKDFAIAPELVPLMIQFITKELYAALIKPADRLNDASDTISDLMTYIRRNMKNDFLKQLES